MECLESTWFDIALPSFGPVNDYFITSVYSSISMLFILIVALILQVDLIPLFSLMFVPCLFVENLLLDLLSSLLQIVRDFILLYLCAIFAELIVCVSILKLIILCTPVHIIQRLVNRIRHLGIL